MNRRTVLAAAAVATLVSPSYAADDSVSPAKAKIILDYYHAKCDADPSPSCQPAGVDLAKNEVRVLARDLSQRQADLDALANNKADSHGNPQNHTALFQQYCKGTPPRLEAEMAIYKMFGDDHANELLRNIVQDMWQTCQVSFTAADKANAEVIRRIKVIDFKLVSQSAAVANDVAFDFDSKTGTLHVTTFDSVGLPKRDSKSWNNFLANQ